MIVTPHSLGLMNICNVLFQTLNLQQLVIECDSHWMPKWSHLLHKK
jgi:hypothetical protein